MTEISQLTEFSRFAARVLAPLCNPDSWVATNAGPYGHAPAGHSGSGAVDIAPAGRTITPGANAVFRLGGAGCDDIDDLHVRIGIEHRPHVRIRARCHSGPVFLAKVTTGNESGGPGSRADKKRPANKQPSPQARGRAAAYLNCG